MSAGTPDDPPPSFESVQDDPYAILGVDSTATDDEIKSAYRKLCLKYHPDKNQGNPDAEIMFQKVQSAWSILSNPDFRAKYDAGGMEALDGNAMAENGIQVDISQTGFMGSTLLAMFRKLGHPIKTVVAPTVLDAVKRPSSLEISPLEWDVPATGRVGNGQAVFFVLDVDPEHLQQGFAVVASCVHARVKLLLWDLDSEGEWSMAAQEDAVKVGQVNATTLYATGTELLEGVPRSVQAHVQAAAMVDRGQQDPFMHIFRVLDAAKLKDKLTLKPGQHLLAVYGDNFFKKSQFTLRATLMAEGAARDEVAATERTIMDKRGELLAFEKEFKRARQEFESSVSKLEDYTKELDTLFTRREAEYGSLLGLPAPAAPAAAAAGGTSGTLSSATEAAEPPAAEDSGVAATSPRETTPEDSAAKGGLTSAGGSNSSFVTEQAKVLRNAASQASTQISGAFRGLFSKAAQRKPETAWSSTDTAPGPAAPEAEAAEDADATEDSGAPVQPRARNFFRAFSTQHATQAGAQSADGEAAEQQTVSGGVPDVHAGEMAASADATAQPQSAPPAPRVPEGTDAAKGGAAAGVGAEVSEGSSVPGADMQSGLSGALFVSGLPQADDDSPMTPAAPATHVGDEAAAFSHDIEPPAAAAADATALPADSDIAREGSEVVDVDPATPEASPDASSPAVPVASEAVAASDAEPADARAPTIDAPAAVECTMPGDIGPPADAPASVADAAAEVLDSVMASQGPPALLGVGESEEPALAAAEEQSVNTTADIATAADEVDEPEAAAKVKGPAEEASEGQAAEAESSVDAFADAPESQSTTPEPAPPAKESSRSSLVKRMAERFAQSSES